MALKINGEFVYPLSENSYRNLTLVLDTLETLRFTIDDNGAACRREDAMAGFITLLTRDLENIILDIHELNKA